MAVSAGVRACAQEPADDTGSRQGEHHRPTHDQSSRRTHASHARAPSPLNEKVKTAFLQASWFVARSSIDTRGAVAPCAGRVTEPRAGTTIDTKPSAMFDCVTCRFARPSQPGRELPESTFTRSALTRRSKSKGFEIVSGRGAPLPG